MISRPSDDAVVATPSTSTTRAPSTLRVLLVVLVLYAGRLPPYVAETVLLLVGAQAVNRHSRVARSAGAALALAVVGVVTVQVVLEQTRGMQLSGELARNLAAIYYSGFAFAVYALLRRWEMSTSAQEVTRSIERALARSAPYLLAYVCALAVRMAVLPPDAFPPPPTPLREFVGTSGANMVVPLIILLAMIHRATPDTAIGRHRRACLMIWGAAAIAFAFEGRGLALALVVGGLACRPDPARLARWVYVAGVVVAVLWLTGVSISAGRREISYTAAVDATLSVIAPEEDAGQGDFGTTRDWRLDWWKDIWSDVAHEPMVLAGHGWGVNLAEQYGIGLERSDDRFNYPHNIFLSIAGHGGLIVAVAFVGVPLCTIAKKPTPPRGGRFLGLAARSSLAGIMVVAMLDAAIERALVGSVYWIIIGLVWWVSAPPPIEGARRSRQSHVVT